MDPATFTSLALDAAKDARHAYTKLGITTEHLRHFANLELAKLCEQLDIGLEDLKFVLRNLIMTTSPVIAPVSGASLVETPKGTTINLTYWSKGFGVAARLFAGSCAAISVPNRQSILASVEQGKARGYVRAEKSASVDEFI
jgi:hypothetical protein